VYSGPEVAAGLVRSCLHWQCKPKAKKDLKDNSSSCFDNLQHYLHSICHYMASAAPLLGGIKTIAM